MSAQTASRERVQRRGWRIAAWDSPTTSYYLIGAVALVLLGLGLVMVLSSSTVYSLRDSEGASPFGNFMSQAKFALMALPVAYVVSRLPIRWLKPLSWVAMAGAFGLTLMPILVSSVARGAGGNNAWIYVAGFSLQPAEFAKLGLAMWLGAVLAAKQQLLGQLRHVLIPGGIGALAMLATVLYTKDLGTAMIIMMLIAACLWVAGVPKVVFYTAAIAAVGLVAALVFTSTNRMNRILAALGLGPKDAQGIDFQQQRALEGLGTGGISGVGLGQSREKWLYLPEAHNDFIFAIIGEELGLLGSLFVVALYVLLAVGVTRIVKRHDSMYAKITAAGIGAWIIGQALVNIGVAIGVLPVIGVPLPLISSGGSSLIATMIGLGVLLALARTEPGTAEALAARKGSIRRSLAVLAPRRRSTRG